MAMSSMFSVDPTIAAVTRLPHVDDTTFSKVSASYEPKTCSFEVNVEGFNDSLYFLELVD